MKIFNIVDDNTSVTFRLGRNAKENHGLIDHADPEDWWFHIKDHPSGHCIVEKNQLSKQDIIFAGKIVKEHSKQKNKKISIIYTQVKFIKKTKIPGEVILLGISYEIIL